MSTTLTNLRRRKGLRIIDLSYMTHIHPTHLASVENRKAAASATARSKLADFFGVEQNELFEPGGLAVAIQD